MNKMIKAINKKTLLGIYFIIFGVLAGFSFFSATFTVSMIMCCFLLIIGISFVIISFINKGKNGFLFIIGNDLIFIMIYSLFWLLFKFEIEKTWSLIPLCCGITFLLYCFLIKKSFGIFISGIFITLLSIVLFFFSCGFFQKEAWSFKKFLFLFVTLCFIGIGLLLLQAGQKEKLSNDEDESE